MNREAIVQAHMPGACPYRPNGLFDKGNQRRLTMKTRILGALLIGAFITSIPLAVEAHMHGDKEKKEGLKVVECPPECGFMVRSHEKEVMIEIVKDHARTYHDMEMTDEEVKAVMKDARKAKKDKDREKDKDKERSPRY